MTDPDGPSGGALPSTGLARELTGDLPCVSCRYNLRGLSIRSNCPECGAPVRATILAVVDPRARELAPVSHPWLTSWGLIAWSAGALTCAGLLWLVRAIELFGGAGTAFVHAGRTALGAACLSAVGATTLIRPQSGTPTRQVVAAIIGVVAYVPLIWLVWRVLFITDASGSPYGHAGDASTERTLLRLGVGAAMIVIILGLRMNVRALAGRWVLMRTGRVDRQPMLGVLIAVLVAALGDLIHLLPSEPGDASSLIGTLFIAAGSMFVLVGLGGMAVDAVRLRRVLRQRVLSLDDLTRGEP